MSLALDEAHGGHIIFLFDHVIADRAGKRGSANDPRRWVMTHVQELVKAAERRIARQPGMPQFIVITRGDLEPAGC